MRLADQVIERCRRLAACTEEPGFTTRTFLSEPMREVHALVCSWMEQAGMRVAIDGAANIRGSYDGRNPGGPRLYIGSHLDTVPRAGAFDGILGVVLGIALVGALEGRRFGFDIEVIGFSEEEGVRFGVPFIGSRALIGELDSDLLNRVDANGVSVREAIERFGLDPDRTSMVNQPVGFLEFHIEQGPILEELGYPLAVVDSIAGQTRLAVTFHGKANHAGTTPMHLRRDALAGAAEWMMEVERAAGATPGMVATTGTVEVHPGASNVIAGEARVSLDARHPRDEVRRATVEQMLVSAREIAARRGLTVCVQPQLDQPSVAMDGGLSSLFDSGLHRMSSGAGHDAMILARRMPAAMLFLRSPGGISHHPDEAVLPEDMTAALGAGARFLEKLEASRG